MQKAANSIAENPQAVQIAFFGGSFTAINREYMISLLHAADKEVKAYGLGGIRISTRPDKIDEEILTLLKRYGVTAIELGAQSLCDEVLRANRRGHTAEDICRAAAQINAFGFELGLQMMTGLYQDTEERAIETARKMIAVAPKTVRIYPTLLFADTYLYELWQAGKYQPQTLEEAVSLCAALIPLFEKAGIRVIRTGLHADAEMQGKYVAGPFHPAFKELCLSRIFYQKVLSAMRENVAKTEQTRYTIKVNPKFFSAAVGPKKQNIAFWENEGFFIEMQQDNTVKPGDFLLL